MANVKSLADLNDEEQGSDSDNGGFNDYYAGGEKSGQLIRGAPKDDKDDDGVQGLFDKAKRAGAVQGTADDLKAQAGSSTFQGTGRTLAGNVTQNAPPQGPKVYVITFYRNNVFTVNDGPPRSITDSANQAFVSAITRGECPEELEPEIPGTPITVNLMRKESDYEAPAQPKQSNAFVGTGRTLGAGGGGGGGGAASSSAAAASSSAAADVGEWAGADDSKPTTSLQLRLADGSRMVARFNHTHRVSDIRRFIRAARSDMTFPYTFMTGVPPTPVTEEGDPTLEDAGLLNSVIIQKK